MGDHQSQILEHPGSQSPLPAEEQSMKLHISPVARRREHSSSPQRYLFPVRKGLVSLQSSIKAIKLLFNLNSLLDLWLHNTLDSIPRDIRSISRRVSIAHFVEPSKALSLHGLS